VNDFGKRHIRCSQIPHEGGVRIVRHDLDCKHPNEHEEQRTAEATCVSAGDEVVVDGQKAVVVPSETGPTLVPCRPDARHDGGEHPNDRAQAEYWRARALAAEGGRSEAQPAFLALVRQAVDAFAEIQSLVEQPPRLHDPVVGDVRAKAHAWKFKLGNALRDEVERGRAAATPVEAPLPPGAIETMVRRLGGAATFTRDELRRGEQQHLERIDDSHTLKLSVRWDT